jgi:hypothetical protein
MEKRYRQNSFKYTGIWLCSKKATGFVLIQDQWLFVMVRPAKGSPGLAEF